jgi:hypothetical protein
MIFILHPFQFVLAVPADWLNRESQPVVEYLHAVNQILEEIHGKKRILLKVDQHRRAPTRFDFTALNLLAHIEYPE